MKISDCVSDRQSSAQNKGERDQIRSGQRVECGPEYLKMFVGRTKYKESCQVLLNWHSLTLYLSECQKLHLSSPNNWRDGIIVEGWGLLSKYFIFGTKQFCDFGMTLARIPTTHFIVWIICKLIFRVSPPLEWYERKFLVKKYFNGNLGEGRENNYLGDWALNTEINWQTYLRTPAQFRIRNYAAILWGQS